MFWFCHACRWARARDFDFHSVVRTMGYSPWGSKNRIGSKKFMQVEVDVKCMETNFDGHGLSSFGDFAPFCLPS